MSGKNIKRELIDKAIANFEFECLVPIANWCTLYMHNGDSMEQLKLHINE